MWTSNPQIRRSAIGFADSESLTKIWYHFKAYYGQFRIISYLAWRDDSLSNLLLLCELFVLVLGPGAGNCSLLSSDKLNNCTFSHMCKVLHADRITNKKLYSSRKFLRTTFWTWKNTPILLLCVLTVKLKAKLNPQHTIFGRYWHKKKLII